MKITARSLNFNLPIILIMFFPWISFINYVNLAKSLNIKIHYTYLANDTMVFSILILLVWALNAWLIRRNYQLNRKKPVGNKIVITLFCNLLLLAFYLLIVKKLSLLKNLAHVNTPYSIMLFKSVIVTMLIVYIQTSAARVWESNKMKVSLANLHKENVEARLSALKEQINPHFLFNALSTLQYMVNEKDVNTEKFITKLSDTYRQLLKIKDIDTLSLTEECIFLDNYIFMMQVRFEDSLHFKTTIMPESKSFHLPAFSLQMLVENAIKHNIVSATKPLRISIYQKDTSSITVENNFQPKLSVENYSGTGLVNLKKRYELLQIPNALAVEQTDDLFSVTIKLF